MCGLRRGEGWGRSLCGNADIITLRWQLSLLSPPSRLLFGNEWSEWGKLGGGGKSVEG